MGRSARNWACGPQQPGLRILVFWSLLSLVIIDVQGRHLCGPRWIQDPVADHRMNTALPSVTYLMRLVTMCNPVLDIARRADSVVGKFTREVTRESSQGAESVAMLLDPGGSK